jgi:hypothetical protein
MIIVKLLSVSNSDGIAILSSSMYVDMTGFLHVVGEVQNKENYTVSFVEVSGTFYDDNKEVVATRFTYAEIDAVRSEEKSAFDILVRDKEQIPKIKSYQLSVQGEIDGAPPKLAMLKLSVGDGYADASGFYHQVGEVTNIGTETAIFVGVAAAFYNNGGGRGTTNNTEIVVAGFTFTQPKNIEPNQSAPFDILVKAPATSINQIRSASVNVESDQYSMVN